jgi:hypothetical protein
MLTVRQAVESPTYRRARAAGYGAADAVDQARSAYAFRRAALETIRESKERSAAARRGWKTRRFNGER